MPFAARKQNSDSSFIKNMYIVSTFLIRICQRNRWQQNTSKTFAHKVCSVTAKSRFDFSPKKHLPLWPCICYFNSCIQSSAMLSFMSILQTFFCPLQLGFHAWLENMSEVINHGHICWKWCIEFNNSYWNSWSISLPEKSDWKSFKKCQ